MTTIIKPPYTAWQDAEGTIPADKEGDRVARIDYPAGVWWLDSPDGRACMVQPVAAHRPSIVAGAVRIDRGEWLVSSAELKP